MRRFGLGLLLASGTPMVLAHGTIPTSNGVGVLASGEVLLGTNFGLIYEPGTPNELFVCETAITGTQQAMDLWVFDLEGRVGAAAYSGDFLRGVYRADTDGCAFGVVPNTDKLLVTDLKADTQWVAVGHEPAPSADQCEQSALYVGSPGVMEKVLSRCRTTSASVATRGEKVLAIFSDADKAYVYDQTGQVKATHTLGVGVEWRALGISEGGLSYVVQREAERDLLLVSEDGGLTVREIGSWPARLSAFASAQGKVWVQSPQQGVLTGEEGEPLRFVAGNGPHGACLLYQQGYLYACGVPWQDGYALGRSDGQSRFEAVMGRYDSLTQAKGCAPNPSIQDTCQAELNFLRGYYGFTDTVSPEPEPSVEPNPEASPEVVEVVEEDGQQPKDEGGCHGAGLQGGALLLTAAFAFARRRRGIHAFSQEN